MKKADVKLGGKYMARVSSRLVEVVLNVELDKGWSATNMKTGREIHIKSAQRLRPILPAGQKWTPEEVAGRKTKAEAGRGSGIYDPKHRPAPTGRCLRCGEAFPWNGIKSDRPQHLFCDRFCRAAYWNYPTSEELKSWAIFDGDCEATDGCRIEPDGTCSHGLPSWLKVFKLI